MFVSDSKIGTRDAGFQVFAGGRSIIICLFIITRRRANPVFKVCQRFLFPRYVWTPYSRAPFFVYAYIRFV